MSNIKNEHWTGGGDIEELFSRAIFLCFVQYLTVAIAA